MMLFLFIVTVQNMVNFIMYFMPLQAISAAVALKPPTLCYPVSDLASECPVGWTASMGTPPRLQDCLQMKPGSTVGDVFEALKRGVISSSAAVVHGEFVRAEGRGLLHNSAVVNATTSPPPHTLGWKVTQLRRDSVIDSSNCVLRIQTNRKSVWQAQTSGGATPAAVSAAIHN